MSTTSGLRRIEHQSDTNANAFHLSFNECTCDMRELTCLPKDTCMRTYQDSSQLRVSTGTKVRNLMRQNMTWSDGADHYFFPLGKSIQYAKIDMWKNWARGRTVRGRVTGDMGILPDDDLLAKDCSSSQGISCFLKDVKEPDEFDKDVAGSDFDSTGPGQAMEQMRQLNAFRQLAASTSDGSKQAASSFANEVLLSFAHLTRIGFNMKPNMQLKYKSLVVGPEPKDGSLKVALHMRRADACHGGYVEEPSAIDAPAMTTPQRKCYTASVYAKVLKDIYQKYNLPLHILLSTDNEDETEVAMVSIINDVNSVIADDKMKNDLSWNYLNHTRSQFSYARTSAHGTIDFVQGKTKNALAQSAVHDLWHLSHADIFVGTLGSRFSKMGYMLAVARQNSLVPYVSLDGHSVCCENDENCKQATQQMDDMGDCLLFAHELAGKPCGPDYWTNGCETRNHVSW